MLACALRRVAAPASAAEPLDLETLDGPTAVRMMDQGTLTSVELTRQYIARIAALNKRGPGLNAVTQLNQQALKDAAVLDKERKDGKVRGPAHGLPILLKDLIDVKGMYTSAGNFSLRNSFPETDSGIAKKLRENGVVILGKLGLSEFANYFGNQPSGFSNLTGQVIHGLDADQNPSGSSSGSGTAGTAALSMLIIGTATGGSIISPVAGAEPRRAAADGRPRPRLRRRADRRVPGHRRPDGPHRRQRRADAAVDRGQRPDQRRLLRGLWGPGMDPSTVVPPHPPTAPELPLARSTWTSCAASASAGTARSRPGQPGQGGARRRAGAILVERPVIDAPAPSRPRFATRSSSTWRSTCTTRGSARTRRSRRWPRRSPTTRRTRTRR